MKETPKIHSSFSVFSGSIKVNNSIEVFASVVNSFKAVSVKRVFSFSKANT